MRPSLPDREVMDVHEAAAYLGIHVDSLRGYACSGTVPAFKFGNRWRFKKSRLDDWMDRESMKNVEGSNDAGRDAH